MRATLSRQALRGSTSGGGTAWQTPHCARTSSSDATLSAAACGSAAEARTALRSDTGIGPGNQDERGRRERSRESLVAERREHPAIVPHGFAASGPRGLGIRDRRTAATLVRGRASHHDPEHPLQRERKDQREREVHAGPADVPAGHGERALRIGNRDGGQARTVGQRRLGRVEELIRESRPPVERAIAASPRRTRPPFW